MNKSIENKLEDSIVRIYEGLYRQIKESVESEEDSEVTLKDLNMKIDVIMDALGLKEDAVEEETTEEKTEVVEEPVEGPTVEFEEKTEETKEEPEE